MTFTIRPYRKPALLIRLIFQTNIFKNKLMVYFYSHTSSFLSVDTHRRDDECFEMEQHFLKKFPQNSSVATLSTDGDVDSHRTN